MNKWIYIKEGYKYIQMGFTNQKKFTNHIDQHNSSNLNAKNVEMELIIKLLCLNQLSIT